MNDVRCQIDSPATLKEALRLIHDLQGRLIQLESQNEELLRDINTRQQVKQTLHHYEHIVAATPDSVALLDRNYAYLAVNTEYLRRTGQPREAIIGRTFAEVMSEDIFALVRDRLDRCLAGELVQFQTWCELSRKGRCFLDVSYAPYRDETDAIAGIVITSRDITDLKRTEEALHESEQRFRGYFEQGLIGMAITSPEKKWIQFNDRLCEILGYPPEELSRKTWTELTHPADLATDLEQLGQVLAGRTDICAREKRYIRRDGVVIDAEMSARCVRRPDGTIRHFVSVIQDITERKRAERLVVESKNELQRVYDSVPVMICQLQPDRKVIEANEFFRSRTGWPDHPIALSEKACGVLGCINALDDPRGCGFGPNCKNCALRLAIRDTIKTGRTHTDIEYQTTLLVDGVGKDFTALCSTAAIQKNDQNLVLLSLIDITERKRIEAESRQSEQRFRTLVDLLPYGVQESNVEGRITFANPALERLHGSQEGGLVGRFIWDFVADAAAREELRNYLQFLVREQPPPVTYFSKDRRADGAVIDVQVDWSYNRDQQGRVQGFIAIVADITERQRIEQQLQLNQFSTDESALAIYWLDVEDRFLYANAQACHSLGYSLAELRTLHVWDIDPDFPEVCSAPFWQEIRQKKVARFESIHRRKDGSIFPVELSVRYAAYQGKEYNFAFAQNITERRQAEQRLAESAQRLQQLSRRLLSVQEEERRALARELHDDFGQQLTALKLNLAMLERDLRDPMHRTRLADCIHIVESARESIQNTARQLRPAILDDLGLVEALHWYARSQAERSGCTIEVQDRLSMLLPPELETAIFRIVQEAVNNALRHGQSRRIDITTEVDQRELTLVIQDDGVGFDPDTRAATENPSGLGLISMSERATLLGGRFSFASRPGAGVRIEVAIPLAEERA